MRPKSPLSKGLSIVIILVFVGTVILPSDGLKIDQASSQTRAHRLFVGGNGPGNYSKIQDAVDDAVEGDTVFVYDDSSPYFEHVVINKAIRVIGENEQMTVIDGSGSGTVVSITASQVSFGHFYVKNCGNWSENILLSHATGCSIHDNTIVGNVFTYIDGISLDDSNNNTITHNNVSHFWSHGIYTYQSNMNNISYNTVFSCYDTGILIHYHSNNNTIVGNKVQEVTYHGITLHTNCQGNTIWDNTCANTSIGILLYQSRQNEISHNILTMNSIGVEGLYSHDSSLTFNNIMRSDEGIFLWDESTYMTIADNLIHENYYGICVRPSISINITRNTLTQNNISIYVRSSTDINISDNTIINGTDGVFFYLTNYSVINSNHLSSNQNGLVLKQSSYNNIVNNKFTHQLRDGIDVDEHSNHNMISKNALSTSGEFGIYHNNSLNNSLSENTIKNNKNDGIYLNSSFNILVWMNTISRNLRGIHLRNSTYMDISSNRIVMNELGIFLETNANHNLIEKNVIRMNKCGVYLWSSRSNNITSNNIVANRGIRLYRGGARLYYAFNNTFYQNNFKRNFPDAFFIMSNTTWDQNYWSLPRVSPKRIYGSGSDVIPSVNYDQHPRLLPFIIFEGNEVDNKFF